jgi:diacylglycerol kinase (ATP)
MQRKFVFLLNPRAGVQTGKPLAEIITEKCSAGNNAFEIMQSNAGADYEWLRKKIAEENITDVIVCGGDGTISTVASAIRDLEVRIGIIPRGSGNGLALAAGISKNPSKAIDIILKGNSKWVDAFLINQQFSCMLSGIGFDAQVAHDFDKQEKRGFWKYAELTVKNLKALRTWPVEIKTPDEELKTNAYFISIANSNQFGNHFTIAPKASLRDGLLDIVVVEKTNFLLLLFRIFWHIRFGTFTKNIKQRRGIFYFQTKELSIYNPALAPLHIDGDGKETSGKFEVQVIKKAYRLLMP